jgi:hypothetical protein
MATFLVYFSQSGVPAAGLTPAWHSLHETGGADRVAQAPAITAVGGGWYRYEAVKGTAPWEAGNLVGVIDGGVTLGGAERYVPVILSEQTLQRQADLVLGAAVAAAKSQAGSLAADVNLIRQALAGKRTQEVATGRIRIYDTDNTAVLKTLQPDEQDGVLAVQEE